MGLQAWAGRSLSVPRGCVGGTRSKYLYIPVVHTSDHYIRPFARIDVCYIGELGAGPVRQLYRRVAASCYCAPRGKLVAVSGSLVAPVKQVFGGKPGPKGAGYGRVLVKD